MRTRERWVPLFAVALLLGLTGWFFGRAIGRDESFAFRDSAHYYYPLFRWCCGEWGAGRVPLWNPLENTGEPMVANATASLFYPGKLIFTLTWLDFSRRFVLYIVSHVLLAAIGAYCAARRFRASRLAATLAGLCYACSGSVLFQYCNVVFLVGAAWLPFAALTTDMLFRRPTRRLIAARRDGLLHVGSRVPAAVALGAVLALMTLGGDPESAYHAGLLAVGYGLLSWLRERRTKTSGQGCLPSVGAKLALLGLAAVTGMALSAVQVFPASAWARASDRASYTAPRSMLEAVATLAAAPSPPADNQHESPWRQVTAGLFGPPPAGSHHEHIYQFSIGPWRFSELLWPNIGGRLLPENRRWMHAIPAEGRVWSPSLYMGLVPVLLAGVAWRVRRGSVAVRWLTWLTIAAALGSLGTYGLGWVEAELRHALNEDRAGQVLGYPVGGLYWWMVTFLPGYVYFRYPAKLLVIATLGASLLAAKGFDAAQRSAAIRRRLVRRALTVAILSGVGFGLAFVFRSSWIGWLERVPAEDHFFGPLQSAGAWRDMAGAFLHAVVVTGWAAWLWGTRRRLGGWRADIAGRQNSGARLWAPQSWQAIGIVALTVVDIGWANGWMVVTAPSDIWREPSPLVSLLESQDGAARVPARIYRSTLPGGPPSPDAAVNSVERMHNTVRMQRETWFPKYSMLDGVGSVESYGTMMNADYAAVLHVSRRRGPRRGHGRELPAATLHALGARLRIMPAEPRAASAEAIVGIRADALHVGGWRVRPADETLPAAWIVHEIQTMPAPRERDGRTLRGMTEQIWFPAGRPRDLRRTAVVEVGGADDFAVAARRTSSDALPREETCQIQRYESNRIVIEASLVEAGLLVLPELYWPGWRADVDGREVPIWRTNRVMRGVLLEPGTHRVEMRYRPTTFVAGLLLSGTAWLLLVAGTLWGFRARRSFR